MAGDKDNDDVFSWSRAGIPSVAGSSSSNDSSSRTQYNFLGGGALGTYVANVAAGFRLLVMSQTTSDIQMNCSLFSRGGGPPDSGSTRQLCALIDTNLF